MIPPTTATPINLLALDRIAELIPTEKHISQNGHSALPLSASNGNGAVSAPPAPSDRVGRKQRAPRGRVMFWLNGANESDIQLWHWILDLKSRRQFTQTLRDAMRLIRDLRNGDTDVLLELFPHIKDKIQSA